MKTVTDFGLIAQSLVSTYEAIPDPTQDDFNTLIFGITNLLNTPDITASEVTEVLTVVLPLVEANTTILSSFTLDIDQEEMSPEIYEKFEIAVIALGKSSGDEYNALYTMYKNLSFSNFMSVMIDANTVTAFYNNLIIYVSKLLNTADVDILKDSILEALTNNAEEPTSGMAKSEFISACQDILESMYLLVTSDQISYLKTSFERFVKITFLNSSIYSSKMSLSQASSLTSTVTTKFGVSSIPLTPENSQAFIEEVSTFYLIYPFTDSEISEIQSGMMGYFESIDYTMGLSAVDVGGAWLTFETIAIPMIKDTLDYTKDQWFCFMKTSFTNITTSLYTKGVSNVLNALAYFDSFWIEDIYVENKITNEEVIAGNYLSDWLDTFIENLTPKIDQTLSNALKIAITDLIQTENNAVYQVGILRGYAVSGQNFIQICIEILLFLSPFIKQADLDEMALQLTDYLVSILYVSSYVDEFWKIIKYTMMILVAIVIITVSILISVFTGGAAAPVAVAVTEEVVGEVVSEGASELAATELLEIGSEATFNEIESTAPYLELAGEEVGEEVSEEAESTLAELLKESLKNSSISTVFSIIQDRVDYSTDIEADSLIILGAICVEFLFGVLEVPYVSTIIGGLLTALDPILDIDNDITSSKDIPLTSSIVSSAALTFLDDAKLSDEPYGLTLDLDS